MDCLFFNNPDTIPSADTTSETSKATKITITLAISTA